MDEKDKKDKTATLDEKKYSINLRVRGKITLIGVKQEIIETKEARQQVREAMADIFGVDVDAVVLPTTKQTVPLIDKPKPTLLLEKEKKLFLKKGFFGGMFSKIKNMFKSNKGGSPHKPPPLPPPLPPSMAVTKFTIGCTTEEEQKDVFKIGKSLMSGVGKITTNDFKKKMIEKGLSSVKNVLDVVITKVEEGGIVDTMMEPRVEEVVEDGGNKGLRKRKYK